jgi:glycosyltransferase
MKISIITVSYNSATTIADTLRSVAAQTHPDIEHIVIDGGSRDDTMAVVHEHGHHVVLCISEPDRGTYDAMNKGLERATGEYVGFLNADDMYADKNAVARLAAAAVAKPDLIYGDLQYVRKHHIYRVVRTWRSGIFDSHALRRGWMPPHPTFYLRRDLLASVGRFDTSLRVAADYDFMLRCLLRPGCLTAYVPHVLVRMRTGGASNVSLSALLRKSREDLAVMKRHAIGGLLVLLQKNLRKLPQFLLHATR